MNFWDRLFLALIFATIIGNTESMWKAIAVIVIAVSYLSVASLSNGE